MLTFFLCCVWQEDRKAIKLDKMTARQKELTQAIGKVSEEQKKRQEEIACQNAAAVIDKLSKRRPSKKVRKR